MATQKTKGKEPSASSSDKSRFKAAAVRAPMRRRFYDKLKFGNKKTDAGFYDVEFLVAEPREFQFEDNYNEGRLTTGWSVDVRILGSSDNFKEFWSPDSPDKDPDGNCRSVILRVPEELVDEKGEVVMGDDGEPKLKLHSLTQGVLNLVKDKGTLLNVKARLTARTYDDDRFGETRVYDVTQPPSVVGKDEELVD